VATEGFRHDWKSSHTLGFSFKHNQQDRGQVIQTSAAISPGSSGGGLFDAEGQLVAITTFSLNKGQNLNFALPGEWVLAIAQR
jgi:S1-C subfamily serine protease